MQRYGLSDGGWSKGEVIELSDDEESVEDVHPMEPATMTEQKDLSSGENRTEERSPADLPAMPSQKQGPYTAITATNGLSMGEDPEVVQEQEVGVAAYSDTGATVSDDGDEPDADAGVCPRCGTYVFGFAADAHARWHEQVEAD